MYSFKVHFFVICSANTKYFVQVSINIDFLNLSRITNICTPWFLLLYLFLILYKTSMKIYNKMSFKNSEIVQDSVLRSIIFILENTSNINMCWSWMVSLDDIRLGYSNIKASLVAQLVKNPPAMQETWVRSSGWEDPWRRERLPTPVFWPGEFHGLYCPYTLARWCKELTHWKRPWC